MAALLILVEYCFLSVLALYAFGSKISLSSTAHQAALERSSLSGVPVDLEPEKIEMSWCAFLSAILTFNDTLQDMEPSSDLTESLLGSGDDSVSTCVVRCREVLVTAYICLAQLRKTGESRL